MDAYSSKDWLRGKAPVELGFFCSFDARSTGICSSEKTRPTEDAEEIGGPYNEPGEDIFLIAFAGASALLGNRYLRFPNSL